MSGSFGNTDKQYKKEINISEYFAKIKEPEISTAQSNAVGYVGFFFNFILLF